MFFDPQFILIVKYSVALTGITAFKQSSLCHMPEFKGELLMI